LEKVLTIKKDFKQLEDFNAKGEEDDHDSEYQKQYFENLQNSKRAATKPRQLEVLSPDEIDLINEHWEDNDATSLMWKLVSEYEYTEFLNILLGNPGLAHIRSADGRGPMFWAYEYKRSDMVHALKSMGGRDTVRDAQGITAADLLF
jgi:dolichyl-diphosphooligosaccharide--protein glycosyltransferase